MEDLYGPKTNKVKGNKETEENIRKEKERKLENLKKKDVKDGVLINLILSGGLCFGFISIGNIWVATMFLLPILFLLISYIGITQKKIWGYFMAIVGFATVLILYLLVAIGSIQDPRVSNFWDLIIIIMLVFIYIGILSGIFNGYKLYNQMKKQQGRQSNKMIQTMDEK